MKEFNYSNVVERILDTIRLQVGSYSKPTAGFRNSKRNDHWTAFVRAENRDVEYLKTILKSVEFSDNPFFTNPVTKINYCLADRNKNDYA